MTAAGRMANLEAALDRPRDVTAAGDFRADDAIHDWRETAFAHQGQPDPAQPLVLQRARSLRERYDEWLLITSDRFERLDLAPDLAANIGSGRWFRGFGTMIGLGFLSLLFWPSFAPLEAAPAIDLDDAARAEYRSYMITPLALGADSGRRMGATAVVEPLKAAPERPQIDRVATLARGDSFARMLERSGVGSGDASRVEDLISRAIALGDIAPGTKVDLTLGRRDDAASARPLDSLSFRARFDLELEIVRSGGNLALKRNVIRTDETPLRIRGTVGSSLYRSARAAGAPAGAVQAYLKALGDHADLDRAVSETDTFDIIISHRRAATGERQAGKLLYAGIDRGGKPKIQLMRWGSNDQFYEASGVGEQRSGLLSPVPGPVSSRYGMRRHPILGYRRMHGGMDFRARHGTPIIAVTDGRVTYAGRKGGYGNFVRLSHAGDLGTGYAHLSRIAVRSGASVRRGQVIGYVGSTGLSTGPHLHYEMYRGNRRVDPASVKFVTRAELSGEELRKFRAQLGRLKSVEAGAALASLQPDRDEAAEPVREIDRLGPQG